MLEQEFPVGTSVQLALSAPVVLHRAAGREAEALQPLLQLDKTSARLPVEATGKAWPVLISGHLRNCGSGSAAVLSWLKRGLYTGPRAAVLLDMGLPIPFPSQSQESSWGEERGSHKIVL